MCVRVPVCVFVCAHVYECLWRAILSMFKKVHCFLNMLEEELMCNFKFRDG